MFRLGFLSNLLALSFPLAAEMAKTPESALERVTQSRLSLTSGDLTVHVAIEKPADDYWESTELTCHVLFDHGDRRIDVHHSGVTRTGKSASGDVQTIFRRDGRIFAKPLGPDSTVQIMDDPSVHNVSDEELDPRVIGLASSGFETLYRFGPSDVFTVLRKGPLTMESFRDSGTNDEMLRISSQFVTLNGQSCASQIVINATRGFSVVSTSCLRPRHGTSMTITNKQWQSGVWFPHEFDYEEFHFDDEAKVLDRRERAVVTAATFMQSIPEKEFDFEAISMEPGRAVRDTREGASNYYQWDGKQLVGHPIYGSVRKPQKPVEPPSGTASRLYWSLNSVACVVLAGALWWSFRKSGNTPNSGGKVA